MDLSFNLFDEQNLEIFLKMEEIKSLAKFAQEMKFFKNLGKNELKNSKGDAMR